METYTSNRVLEEEKPNEEDSGKLRILHVEDNSSDQIILRRSLEKRLKIGFILVTAENGVEGLKKVEENDFDLILLDHHLPHMTGIEFLEELRRRQLETPTIFVTGSGNEKVAVTAMKLGAQDYIIKEDVDSDHLIEAIRNLILELSLPKEVNIETAKHIISLFSISPTIKTEILTTLNSEPESNHPILELFSTLKTLAETDLLKAKPHRSVVACPSCNLLTSMLHLQCPECKSQQMIKGDALEHFSCGNVDFRSKFDKGKGALVCPKCGKEVRQIGVDYRKAGSWYRCSNDHIFPSPIFSFGCPECNEEFSLEEATLEMLQEYQITERNSQRFRLGLFETELIDVDKQLKHRD